MFEICICAPKNPGAESQAIMDVLLSKSSHCFILHNQEMIFHANGGPFESEPAKPYFETHIINDRITLPLDVSEDFALGVLHGMLGIEYSVSQMPGFAMPLLQKLLDNGPGALVCSEAGIRFAQKVSPLRNYKIDESIDFISPEKAMEIMRKAFNLSK